MKQMMEKFGKKFYLFIAAAVVVVIAIVAIVCVSCGGQASQGTTGTEGDSGVAGGRNYSVSVKTAGGMALSEVDVYVYKDDTLADLVAFNKTDENGIVTFSIPENEKYAIALSGVAKGYDVKESYSFSSGTAIITLTSSLIEEDITGASLELGDVMYDFTVTTTDGETVKLSELLKTKKMVMLNFWYTTCSWCIKEFPILEQAYENYKDDIEIVAVNPTQEGVATLKAFKEGQGLTFPVAEVPAVWSSVFGISGYPSSIFIDQYGVICLVEEGAITSPSAWINVFDHFTKDDYTQNIYNAATDLVEKVKPTYEMPSSEEISNAVNKGNVTMTFSPSEGEGSEYAWPFIIGEKDGEKCLYSSNKNMESSFSILRVTVELKKGQALAFDCFSSCEMSNDILHVIVDDTDIFRISGISDKWVSRYPCVAEEDGTYEVVFSYIKDSDDNEGDDTVYLKNFRVVDESEIDTETYIPKQAATSEDGFTYTYTDIVYNEKDGYYHVGSKNGPLLLANINNTSQFNEENSAYLLVSDSATLMVNGENKFLEFQNYSSYASNASISGYCPVTQELKECLVALAEVYGFDSDDANEWMKLCIYYAAYGTNGKQLEDPIKGLAKFSALTATLGKNVATNVFEYDRMIYPRGLIAKFVPNKSGAYRIISRSESIQGVDGWIFDDTMNTITEYEPDERAYDGEEVNMVVYLEAGKEYYIDICFWDLYEEGKIYYDITYLGATYELFRLASPAYFTYDMNDITGDMYYTIAGGIDVVLGSDGIWYEDLGKDANGKQKYGSKLYVDFTGSNGLYSYPIMSYGGVKGMIDLAGFDFRQTENDSYVIAALASHDNDQEKTLAFLKETWGEYYDSYYESYQVEDVFAGKYHGTGADCTELMRQYAAKIDKSSNTERNGCVVATKELTDILQMLMDKYTFEGVENSWTKLCYYYDFIGPEN